MNAVYTIAWISLYTLAFINLDRAVHARQFSHPYYLIHALHNAAIVALTADDVLTTFTNFHSLHNYGINIHALRLCFALHIYHVICYWRQFRVDDWLHHVLMISVALPIGGLLPSTTLLGFSLFFTTGLPGGIDYALLFCVRNGWIARRTEKVANKFLNTWIRSPGCVAQATLTIAYMFSSHGEQSGGILWYLGFIPAILNYWNGQYFMAQIVSQPVDE